MYIYIHDIIQTNILYKDLYVIYIYILNIYT